MFNNLRLQSVHLSGKEAIDAEVRAYSMFKNFNTRNNTGEQNTSPVSKQAHYQVTDSSHTPEGHTETTYETPHTPEGHTETTYETPHNQYDACITTHPAHPYQVSNNITIVVEAQDKPLQNSKFSWLDRYVGGGMTLHIISYIAQIITDHMTPEVLRGVNHEDSTQCGDTVMMVLSRSNKSPYTQGKTSLFDDLVFQSIRDTKVSLDNKGKSDHDTAIIFQLTKKCLLESKILESENSPPFRKLISECFKLDSNTPNDYQDAFEGPIIECLQRLSSTQVEVIGKDTF